MMTTDNSIFPISYSDGVILLYAPLADCALEVTENDITRIFDAIKNNGEQGDEEAAEVAKILTDVVPVRLRPGYVARVADFNNLTILPTNKCNFSCSFCYSRAGRGKESLSVQTVVSILEWFVETCRKPGTPLHITLYGGGEPMLAWGDVVLPTLRRIEKLRNENNAEINVTLITNGSVFPENAIETLRALDVDVVVSFEVMESLQNIHRKHFQKVSDNIRQLIDGGVSPRINTVITPDSVNYQTAIIEQLHSDFPSIDYISLEPENTIGLPASFYRQFTDSFFIAAQRAEEYGIKVTCSALRNCDVTVDRYCAGELCLTPTGKLTLCPCISSESQPGFGYWVYGEANEDGVTVDNNRLKELLNMNLSTMPHCNNCFARYNCGGGCLHNFLQNGRKHDENFCSFTRDFLKRIIRYRYDQSIIEK